MIAFASLFLGMVLGLQTVEVVVGGEVTAVKIFLDGVKVAEMDGPPWSAECDLGAELAPHELVAVARGASGEEIGRAEQWINMPRAAAEATLVLEAGSGGRGRTARLQWESLAPASPRVEVALDGRPLEVADPARIRLPDHDPKSTHLLRSELDFGGGVVSTAEIVFGGRFAEESSSELTAVPVTASERRKVPSAEGLEGWFLAGGRAVSVVAVDKGVAEIVAVRDEGATRDLLGLTIRQPGYRGSRPRLARAWGEWRLQLLFPLARRSPGAGRVYDLFLVSPYLDAGRGPLAALIAATSAPRLTTAPQRLADAVVVAGLGASASKRRRAVVLVLGAEPEDASRLEPGNARGFLERIHVPLFVWSTAETPSEAARAWGEVDSVASLHGLQTAVWEVERALERQRVVWLEGRHLPDRISLSERAEGIDLAR